jgi:menaquinone-specific isochorismate synthase
MIRTTLSGVPETVRPRVLTAHTRAIADPGPLSAYLPADQPWTAWIRRGEGLIGIGEAFRYDTDSIHAADAWWADLSRTIAHTADVERGYGVGPVAFGSFAFDPATSEARSVLVVPRLVIGRRAGAGWVTAIGAPDVLPEPTSRRGLPEIRWGDGRLDPDQWQQAVATAVARIRSGALGKVVLARDVSGTADADIDVREVLARLVDGYPSTWGFHVDGLVGATPELLVRRERGLATSRVLAGTIRRQGDESAEQALAQALAESSKDLAEHEYAVASVADALAPYCSGMNVPDQPYVLKLPNVMHLASDVTGVCRNGASSLAIAEALHPSAAVCGTPTTSALALIRELEHLDRGRYAGPVGWIDSSGDGEWGIALRCGRIQGRTAQLFAGCGIVADSDPVAELAETKAKLIPMRDALA